MPLVWPPVTVDGHRYVDGGATVLAAIGRNVLDPAQRQASARAGYEQAALVVDEVRGRLARRLTRQEGCWPLRRRP